MEDFNIGAIKVRNMMTQFGVVDRESEEIVKARQVGDMHPNGKWVWTEYKPGHFDWRPINEYSNKEDKNSSTPAKKEDTNSKKTITTTQKQSSEKKKTTKVSSVDDYAKKTPTKTLKNAVKKEGVPGSIKGAAEAELKARRDAEIIKKLNLRSKGELANNLVKIASEWGSYSDSDKQIIKQSISQAREQIMEGIDGGNFSTESMNYLADLQSVERYIKGVESGPKPIGEIIDKLLFELKNKDYIKEQQQDSLKSAN